jgi:hypothetical protein
MRRRRSLSRKAATTLCGERNCAGTGTRGLFSCDLRPELACGPSTKEICRSRPAFHSRCFSIRFPGGARPCRLAKSMTRRHSVISSSSGFEMITWRSVTNRSTSLVAFARRATGMGRSLYGVGGFLWEAVRLLALVVAEVVLRTGLLAVPMTTDAVD